MAEYRLLNGIYRYELPKPPDKERDILFAGMKQKDQFWRRTPVPLNFNELTAKRQGEFIEQEVRRMFIDGVWFANNGELVHLPPSAYTYFNHWRMKDGHFPAFRYSQYDELLFEEFLEAIPNCIGSMSFKKRRDGKTTRRMCRKVWKAIQPVNANKWCGLQSKTGPDARDVCWETLMAGYRSLPTFVKPVQSGSSDPKKKLEFRTPSQRLSRKNVRSVQLAEEEDEGLNTTIDYRDTTADAYDGQELLDVDLDEAAKWKKANVLKAFGTYVRCVWKDGVKVGHIHAFSSPSEHLGVEHDRSVTLWNMGDPAKSITYDDAGQLQILKKSWFILRFFTGALEGYGAACDQYGVCDQDLARVMIQEELDNAEPEMRSELERQLPFTIDDVLTNEQDMVFKNAREMQVRKNLLQTMQFKSAVTKEPKYIYGNLEWHGAISDTSVDFLPAKIQDGFSESGKFCFERLPPIETRNRLTFSKLLGWRPPKDSDNVIGIDPFDYRRTESKNISQGAAVGGAALDFYSRGYRDQLWFAYLYRPAPAEFYEDMIMAHMFCSAWGQVESKNKNIIDYFEDRNYMGVLMGKKANDLTSEHKGNATTTNLIDEMSTLLDDFYTLEQIEKMMMDFILADNLKFNPADTLKAHITMAQGQMLLGFMKRRLATRKLRGVRDKSLNRELALSIKTMYNF